MSTPSLEQKINELQERLHRPNIPNSRPGGDMQAGGRPNRPNRLDAIGASRGRRPTILPVPQPLPQQTTQEDDNRWQEIIQRSGLLKISGKEYRTLINDLEHLGELGNGTCGHVVKMLHKPSKAIIAVKQMRRSGNSDENKRITMDIEVVLKSDDCPFIVQCVGCFILEADVWICMELMDTCFDKLLKLLKRVGSSIPEHILGKVTVATVRALHYLKETHGVIHRDVKPSNILLDRRGNVKLCDFGISGRLVDSKAQTRSAGCAAYMAPERIDPPDPNKPDYDIRADVWSLGITLVELATGDFPYSNCNTDFEVLSKVLTSDPPKLPADQDFSDDFRDFVNCCLTKDYKNRPKYRKLLDHAFITKYENRQVNVAEWYLKVLSESEAAESAPTASLKSSKSAAASQVASSTAANMPSNNTVTTCSVSSGSSVNSPLQRYFVTPSSPSLRRSAPVHVPQHVRSVSETGRLFHPVGPSLSTYQSQYQPNGDAAPANSGRWSSPFHSARIEGAGAVREGCALRPAPAPMSPAHAFWQAQEARAAEWDSHRPSTGSAFNSPITVRKRFPSEPPQQANARDHYHSGNASPLVLQRFYHQQQQIQQHQSQQQQPQQHQNHLLHHYHLHQNNHAVSCYPSSVSLHRQIQLEPLETPKVEESSSPGKKRFTSILKFSLGGNSHPNSNSCPPGSPGRLPPPRPARHASPGPPPPSPDPPPRLSRIGLSDGTPTASPLVGRRSYLDVSPVRRGVLDGSPSLPRRYVSPSPPQPPPRRLSSEGSPSSFNGSLSGSSGTSGTTSMPGSPQVRRFDSLRARVHYTPQPQRRVFGAASDFHDL